MKCQRITFMEGQELNSYYLLAIEEKLKNEINFHKM